MKWKSSVFFIIVALLISSTVHAQDEEDSDFGLTLGAELGFVSPFYHMIQFSQDGTEFDYVDEGGQDVLFPFQRYTVEAHLGDRHSLTFLLQPLELETRVRLNRDILVDGAEFDEGTPMVLLYRFPFYRLSYLYDLAPSEATEISIGASLQIRNATISFESADGDLRRENRDVGFVPILKFRARHTLDSDWWFGTEIDGFYAPIRYLNLSDTDVIGLIVEGSLRFGRQIDENVGTFLNARYLGGGADGTSSDDEGPGDGYTKNWLNVFSLTLGFEYRFR